MTFSDPCSCFLNNHSAELSRRDFVATSFAAGGAAALGSQGGLLAGVVEKIAELHDEGGSAGSPASEPRPSILDDMLADEPHVTPRVPAYAIADDLSNVENIGDFYLNEVQLSYLREYGFFIMEGYDDEFFEHYESNRYNLKPSFVTVDAMTHTYHLHFSHLLKAVERGRLRDLLAELAAGMLAASARQLDELAGSAWEGAALRNVCFFGVGASLLGLDCEIPAAAQGLVGEELALIGATAGIAPSPSFGTNEDYSQYIVRGYYEGDPALEGYFRAMMWFGRMAFVQREEDLDRSAALITCALSGDLLATWVAIYTVTSFFAGASDDNGFHEYLPLLEEAYGKVPDCAALVSDGAAWERFHELTATAPNPQINSIPVRDTNDDTDHVAENKGFRFMGQRFSIDAAIFQRLIYNKVGLNANGDKRLLPNALDIPAALGSDEALAILDWYGECGYEGYLENMEALRAGIDEAPEDLWNASLYGQWIKTIRPLTEPHGDGWPTFMQGWPWTRKDLLTFLGSYTELKHDTVLYSKQVFAEMGGDVIQVRDDRGYVEPEPLVFARLAALVGATSRGLARYGMLDDDMAANLGHLEELAGMLRDIAVKELLDEPRSDADYELIRTFGGQLEHLWQEAYKNDTNGIPLTTREFPAAVVTDIATDPNGWALEVGTGRIATIYVVVPIEGALRLATGSVYSFYQFVWPLEDRLTDTRWRVLMGMAPGEDGRFVSPMLGTEAWAKPIVLSTADFY